MDWRTREPRLPDVPVRRSFIVVVGLGVMEFVGGVGCWSWAC